MKETFLHFLWRTRRFECSDLTTTTGEPIDVLQWGELNTHAGPDFLQARLRINGHLWAGSVEMHLRASEWIKHRHQEDPAYRNVVLHVVLEEDQVIFRENGERIPCLSLKDRIPAGLVNRYQQLLHSERWIPCQQQLPQVSPTTVQLWLGRVALERIEQRTQKVQETLLDTRQHWEETYYRLLARSFGARVNMDAFEQLARQTPHLLLGKYKNNLYQMEALLFGQAGLLERSFTDNYPRQLQDMYRFLRHKHQLNPMSASQWLFLRMRPAAFPTLRIALFAALIHQTDHLFSKMLAASSVTEIEHMLAVKLSNYWQTHYVFDKESVKVNKTLGRDSLHLIVINTIVPVMFLYGKLRSEIGYQDKAIELLESVPPENNTIIQQWQSLGIEAQSAFDTQALLHLKQHFCTQRRCLECGIGANLIK
jgi:hypothetical protein